MGYRKENAPVLLLTGLPRGSEVGVDGHAWLADNFSGFKRLTPGLHCSVFSAAPTTASEAIGTGVRHALLRFFAPGDVVTQEWSTARESLESDGRPRKRRCIELEGVEADIVSEERLKTLDRSLAAYSSLPSLGEPDWGDLVDFVTPHTLARVIGLDAQGCAATDALATAESEGLVGTKLRADGRDEADEETLDFVDIDVKRSWPVGSQGEQVTKWSRDKSWLLANVISSQLANQPKELLAELQLAFALCVLVHNYSALTVYRNIVSLLCRSSTILTPNPSLPASLAELPPFLPVLASFLSILRHQLLFIARDESFFVTQLPTFEGDYLDALTQLRSNLVDAATSWNDHPVWQEVTSRWDALAAIGMEKFGWELGVVRVQREGLSAAIEDGEVDVEDLEEGEDAPVIIEL